jgi:hypothetical protein
MRSTPFAFIQSVRAAAHQPSTTVGVGEMVRLSAGDLVGAALQVDGCCVHLAAFRNQAFEDQDIAQAQPKARAREPVGDDASLMHALAQIASLWRLRFTCT